MTEISCKGPWIETLKAAIASHFLAKLKSFIDRTAARDRKHNIHISEEALRLAMYEIVRDVCILQYRRYGLKPTAGKIAGIIVFRMIRAQIIHISDPILHKMPNIRKINYLIALHIGFAFIGQDIQKLNDMYLTELLYNIEKRHSNQETLGLVFDTLYLQ